MKKIFILAILTLGLNAQGTYICVAINVGTIDKQVAISQEDRDNMNESESEKLFFLDDKSIVDGLSTEKYNFYSQENKRSYYASEKRSAGVLIVNTVDKKLFIQSAKQDRVPAIITYQCIKQKTKGKR